MTGKNKNIGLCESCPRLDMTLIRIIYPVPSECNVSRLA